MAFQEKSAWIMSVALLLGGGFYFGSVASLSGAAGELVPPVLPLVAVYTAILIAMSTIGHVVIAVLAPKESNAPADERERVIFHRAGRVSAHVLIVGVVLSLGLYLVSYDGDRFFYGILGSLMVAQTAEYVWRIRLFRSAV